MGVRFISINDGYDSDDYKGTTGGLEVVMRSIIYAAYSKDLSVKTTSAKIQMMKQGKYVGGYAPYGYVLHPTIRNKLAVDPEAADVIRRIFREALEGSNTSQIARSLNDDGIPTPGQYFKSKHPDKKKFSNMSEKISWETVMVYNILKNLVYTGTLVSRKMKSCGVGSKKRVVNEPIIVEGTHEARAAHRKGQAPSVPKLSFLREWPLPVHQCACPRPRRQRSAHPAAAGFLFHTAPSLP